MQSKATTVDAYLAELPKDRQKAIAKLRSVIKKKHPKGFKEGIGYNDTRQDKCYVEHSSPSYHNPFLL